VTVKLNVPIVVGVPASAPVGASSVSPGGVVSRADREHVGRRATTHRNRGWCTPTPVTPPGNAPPTLMVSAPATASVNSFVARDEFAVHHQRREGERPGGGRSAVDLAIAWNVRPGGSAPAFTLQM